MSESEILWLCFGRMLMAVCVCVFVNITVARMCVSGSESASGLCGSMSTSIVAYVCLLVCMNTRRAEVSFCV